MFGTKDEMKQWVELRFADLTSRGSGTHPRQPRDVCCITPIYRALAKHRTRFSTKPLAFSESAKTFWLNKVWESVRRR